MARQQLKMPPVQYDTMMMQGGVDQMTPMMQLKSGVLRDALNFEANILGGYARIGGYERYDGHALPSSSVYTAVFISAFVNTPAVGQTIQGQTSLSTGVVLEVENSYIAVANTSGAFTIGETIKVGATTIGTVIIPNQKFSPQHQATHVALAANYQRTLISAVPGSGPVRGVFVYNDIVYAFRDNVGATATLLYQATTGGWSQIAYLYEIAFTNGSGIPIEGGTLTQGGVTATFKRAARSSGNTAWTGDAAGRLIIAAPAGGNFAAGAATIGSTTVTLSGVQTAITFAIGGIFETYVGNFSGQTNTSHVYGCDGVNRCWEFDGTVLVPISTGFTPDTPKHITVHKNFLFIAIQGSLGYSAPGWPFDWTALNGAGVIAVGDIITNILELPGAQTTATMGVWARGNTFMLYGTGQSTWNLVPFNTGTGAMHYTAQNMAHTYVFDDRGIIDMQTVLNYGNFDIATCTYPINNFIIKKRQSTIGSILCRTKSQYRLFFSDGYGIYMTSLQGQYGNGNTSYNMPVLFPNPVFCAENAKLSSGDEVMYFGSTNGFVYKMDSGSSFDGVAISAYMTFVTNHIGAPQILKHFRHARVEVSGNSYCQFQFGYALGYSNPNIMQPNYATYENNIQLPYWDSFVWDSFTWDGATIIPADCEMSGTGENYAVSIKSYSDAYYPFSINSLIAHYTTRRGRR